MSGEPSIISDLLAECDAHGVRLGLADGSGLEIDAPQDSLTPDLLARLKAHKADVLALVPPGWPMDVSIPKWWPELVGVFPPGFLKAARATVCPDPDCCFGVAVFWRSPDGLMWSCPRCGLTSPDTLHYE